MEKHIFARRRERERERGGSMNLEATHESRKVGLMQVPTY